MWTSYCDSKGKPWLVDQMGVWIFARQCAYAQLLKENSKTVTTHNWFGPNLVSVETDFNIIRSSREQLSKDFYEDIIWQTLDDGELAFTNLVAMRSAMKRDSDALRTMQKNASRETMGNIDASVSRAQTAVEALTVVRDLSATTLVVGATFLSGGAAFGVLGAGSALKGTARYQDSGNVGSAILEASGTFVVGMITMAPALAETSQAVKLGAKVTAPAMATSQRMAIVLVGAQVDAALEGAKSAMEGAGAKEALVKAGARFLTDVASGGAGIKLDKLALPVAARLITDGVAAAASDKAGNVAADKVKPPAVTPKMACIRDCNPVIVGSQSDEDYIRSLVFRKA